MDDVVLQKSAGLPKEILNPFNAAKQYRVEKHSPAKQLDSFIECYWVLHWNLDRNLDRNLDKNIPTDIGIEPPYVCEVLPSPYVNLTFMPRGPRIQEFQKVNLFMNLKNLAQF